nr:FAD-dependent monooxygenase [uncultured Tateyamaria sp.]
MQKDRVFIMGDAAHRHPPSNGLGSNTSIQDAFNLAWKLSAVIRGQAGAALLDSYSQERAPIAKQIVTRANQSIGEFGPIFQALGMTGGDDVGAIKANMDARCDPGAEAEAQRAALRAAIAFKSYEFDAHGVEMNQRYRSDAIANAGQPEPAFVRDAELHYQPTTWPCARHGARRRVRWGRAWGWKSVATSSGRVKRSWITGGRLGAGLRNLGHGRGAGAARSPRGVACAGDGG